MSNQVYDENGYVGDFATNKGTYDYFSYLRGLLIPELYDLFEKGYDYVPEALREVLVDINPPEGLLTITHNAFLSLLEKCEGIVIISDGINEDLEDEGNS